MLIFSVFLFFCVCVCVSLWVFISINKQMKSKSYLRSMCSLIWQAACRYFNRVTNTGKSIIVLKIGKRISRNCELFFWLFVSVLSYLIMMMVSKLIEFAMKLFNIMRNSDCNRSFASRWNDSILSSWLWNFWTLQIDFTIKSSLIPYDFNDNSLHTACSRKLTSIWIKHSFPISIHSRVDFDTRKLEISTELFEWNIL